MAYFFYKLRSPRPTFPSDITPDEAHTMSAHAGYWQNLVEQRRVVIFGPVFDPNGVYGVAILSTDTEETARQMGEADPAIRSSFGFSFELYAMPNAIGRDDLPA